MLSMEEQRIHGPVLVSANVAFSDAEWFIYTVDAVLVPLACFAAVMGKKVFVIHRSLLPLNTLGLDCWREKIRQLKMSPWT